jgi:hypothetical protein
MQDGGRGRRADRVRRRSQPYLGERIDLLLVMTITAGFGGQPFEADHLSKVERAAEIRGYAKTFRSGSRSTGASPGDRGEGGRGRGRRPGRRQPRFFHAPDPRAAARAIRAAAAR